MVDDFSPVVGDGEIEATPGVLGRFKRRTEPAAVVPGVTKMMLGGDGAPIEQVSAGQKYWARARRWVDVDVGEHPLTYEIPFSDPDGRADLVAVVTVMARVNDAGAVVRSMASKVKWYLEPALEQAVMRASADVDTEIAAGQPVAAINAVRKKADAHMRHEVAGPVMDLPSWLDASVTSIRVRLDDATEQHRTGLIAGSRKGETIELEGSNVMTQAKGELALRRLWRDELLPHLRDPTERMFEAAFANPTPENISSAVNQVSRAEFALLGEGLELLRTMVEKDFVDKNDPMFRATEGISGKLQHLYLPSAAAALSAGEERAELTSGTDTPVDGKQRKDDDTNFDDPGSTG